MHENQLKYYCARNYANVDAQDARWSRARRAATPSGNLSVFLKTLTNDVFIAAPSL